MRKTKVIIGDLKHFRNGILFADTMPLGIGYMKAVIDRDLAEEVDCEIFCYPDNFEKALLETPPDIVMVSNYMWNEALSLWALREVKRRNPKTLTIMGGPNLPIEKERQGEFVKNHPEIDIYVIGEGDFLARDLIQIFLNNDCDIEKMKKSGEIYSCVYTLGDEVIVNPVTPKSRKLDEIPSPYLTGVMDKFFDGRLTPLLETNRGCPFTCTFCVQGMSYYTKVSYFDINRVRDEIFYIAEKVTTICPNVKILRVADPNYGMFERDIEISRYMGETQKLYHYPTFIDATTGKNKHENIIKTMEQVSGALIMWQSVQSLDDNVLKNVKRKNIKLETYGEINKYLNSKGLRGQADLILCLPGETLESHLMAMRRLMNSGVLRFNNFQAMLLKGSEMESQESRDNYQFKSKFRPIQKSFSTHNGEIIIETGEIIVETKSFSFDDYIVARKYHLIFNLIINELRFEEILKFLDNIQIPRWDWIQQMYESIESHPFISDIMTQYENDNRRELFDTPEELRTYYTRSDIYPKLESGEIGDNIIHKYRVISNYFNWNEICNYAFESAYKLILKKRQDIAEQKDFKNFWDDFKKYKMNSSANGKSKEELLSESYANFNYNLKDWIMDDLPTDIQNYYIDSPLQYRFYLNDFNRANLQASVERWNSFTLASLSLMVRKIKENWLEKEVELISSTVESHY